MKTLSFITALLLLASLSATGQQERYSKNNNLQPQEESNYQSEEPVVPLQSITSGGGTYKNAFYYGDPCGMYLDNDWIKGEARLLDGTEMEGAFRYNICAQKMEAVVAGDTFAFARSGELEKINIGKSTFIFANYIRDDGELSSSWFELLSHGNCSLMLRRFIKYRVTDGDDDHTDDQLFRLEEYYSCSGQRVLERLYQDRKAVLQTLKRHESEVSSFIRAEKLNVKVQDDLVKVFDYYNELD